MFAVLFLDGTIMEDCNVEEDFNYSQQEFQKYNICNFRTNMRPTAIRRGEECARFELVALENFCEIHTQPLVTCGDYPFWDTSKASFTNNRPKRMGQGYLLVSFAKPI